MHREVRVSDGDTASVSGEASRPPRSSPGLGWVVKQNAADPRWTFTSWREPLAAQSPIAWNCSLDFDATKPLQARVKARFSHVRVGDRIWAWQVDEQAFLGVLLVRETRAVRDGAHHGVELHVQPTMTFEPRLGRTEALSLPGVADAPAFKNPGVDYRLTIATLGVDNERRLARHRQADLSAELRQILFGSGPIFSPPTADEIEERRQEARRRRRREKRQAAIERRKTASRERRERDRGSED